jgi:hypothetical protein
MARPVRVTLSAISVSNPIPLNTYGVPFNVALGVKISSGASLTYSVTYTLDDIYSGTFDPATATWYNDLTAVVGQTANKTANLTYPATAVRLEITAWISGSATLTVIQAGVLA